MSPDEKRGIFGWLAVAALNVWFWSAAAVFSFFYFSFCALFYWLYERIVRDPRKVARMIRFSLNYYGHGIVRCAWPFIRLKFVDLSPTDQPPFVLICNHASASDAFLLCPLWYEIVQLLNIWPNQVPIIRSLARQAGYISVREMPFEQFMQNGAARLKEGCSVLAYPEGTRSGRRPMGNFHGSAFRLAMENKVPIIPLALAGNADMPPRGSAWLRPGRVVLTKLPAITPEQFADWNAFKLKNHVRAIIQDHLQSNPT